VAQVVDNADMSLSAGETRVFDAAQLAALVAVLRGDGYRVIAPTVQQGAIVLDEIADAEALPRGWREDKDGGRYRLVPRDDGAYFGHTVGPQGPKPYLRPPRQRLWQMRRFGAELELVPEPAAPPKTAFLGVRACDLAGLAVLDRVLLDDRFADPDYRARRANALVIAVNCGEAGGTCFCAAMGTGPRARSGYDLALTELIGDARHDFLAETGSDAGGALLARLETRSTTEADRAAAEAAERTAVAGMGRTLDTDGLKELLQANRAHTEWDRVAEHCLTCANCTLVCPTCFCTSVEDTSDLTGQVAERWQRWDSCFTLDFSCLHGGSVRSSAKARYRQWMTHKLADWHDEFAMSGCVGCGRCIAWCPVGIDITEEAAAIRRDPQGTGAA
jgi:ferredoxin